MVWEILRRCWKFGKLPELMHRLAVRDLPPDAITVVLILGGCKRQD